MFHLERDTTKQLLANALKRAGEVPNENSRHFDDALSTMNEVYIDILSGSSKYKLHFGKAWTWAREAEPLFLTLKPKFEDTLTFANGSASGTFSAAQSETMAGRHIKFDNNSREEMYRIKTHVAGTDAFILETPFIGATGGYSARVIKLIYDLGSNVLRLGEPWKSFAATADYDDNRQSIYHNDIKNFNEDYPTSFIGEGVPDRFSVFFKNDDKFEVIFNGYPRVDSLIQIPYVKTPDDLKNNSASVPLIPIEHRTVLEYLTASEILFNFKSDNAQGSIMRNMGLQILQAIIEDDNRQNTNSGKNRGRLIPRPGQLSKTRRRFRRK